MFSTITGGVNYLGIFLDGTRTVLTVHLALVITQIHSKGSRGLYTDFSGFLYHCARWHLLLRFQKKQGGTALSLPYSPEKVRIIPNCHPVDYRYTPKSFDETRPTILQVGTIFYNNIDRLIEAVRGLSCKLVLIGKLSPETVGKLREYGVDYENHFNRATMRSMHNTSSATW